MKRVSSKSFRTLELARALGPQPEHQNSSRAVRFSRHMLPAVHLGLRDVS